MQPLQKERIDKLDDYHKYLKDNEFIVKGYRLYFNSVKKILKSLFIFHNETVNIWTHLLGSISFILLLCYLIFSTEYSSASDYYKGYLLKAKEEYESTKQMVLLSLDSLSSELRLSDIPEAIGELLVQSRATIEKALLLHEDVYDPPVQDVSKWPLFVFILSAIACLSFSAIFHLFNAHSHRVKIFVNSLDYAGIAILILGSFFPPIYYIFFCSSFWIWVYLGSISFLSALVLAVTFTPNFQEPNFRWFRGTVFLLLGLCGVFPIGHIVCFMPQAQDFGVAIIYYALMGFFYVAGVMIYIFRFPERYFHGKLDYIGNSHNIWHCMIVIAAVFHYFAAMESYYKRKLLVCLDN